MSAYPLSERRILRIVSLVSSLLFWLFSLVYLAVFQNELLAWRVDTLFSGKLAYHSWLGALAITFVLWLLQRLICRLKHFSSRWYAFSYTLSFLLLGVITFSTENYRLPLAACVFGAAILLSLLFFARYSGKPSKPSALDAVNLNLQGFLLLCCFTVTVGNTDENLHHELSMASALNKADYARVLLIAGKSLSVSPKMAEYRIRALSATGQLAERLFEYPQVEAVLPLLTEQDSLVKESPDVEMAVLLLKKDLDGFYREITQPGNNRDSLPRYYAEAMILYNYLHPGQSFNVNNEGLEANFKAFIELRLQLKAANTDWVAESGRMRSEFGTTYWFYYYYV